MNRVPEVNQGQQNRGGQQHKGHPSQRPVTRNPDEREPPSNPVEKNEQLDKDGSPGGANG